MRYGVLADVHGNLAALQAAIARLEAAGVDGWLCAGDLIGYGPQPAACVDRILGLRGVVCVAGNHEMLALGGLPEDRAGGAALESLAWTRAQLGDRRRQRLCRLPPRAAAPGGVVVAHGSLRDPEEYVWDVAHAQEVLADLGEDTSDARVLVVGHTHRPLVVAAGAGTLLDGDGTGRIALPENDRVLLNPGAVGQSRGGPPRARCAVLDLDGRAAELLAVRYDVRATRRALRRAGLREDSCEWPDGWRRQLQRARRRARRVLGRR